jgi:hypothetical protein
VARTVALPQYKVVRYVTNLLVSLTSKRIRCCSDQAGPSFLRHGFQRRAQCECTFIPVSRGLYLQAGHLSLSLGLLMTYSRLLGLALVTLPFRVMIHPANDCVNWPFHAVPTCCLMQVV